MTMGPMGVNSLLVMGATRLGVLLCGSILLLLVQRGIYVSMGSKDAGFVTLLFLLVILRCWRYLCPEDRSSTEPTRSSSADDFQISSGCISGLFYGWNLISALACTILSMMRLASQDFGQTEVNKGASEIALNVIYGLAFAEALLSFFALTFVTIMAVKRKVREALIVAVHACSESEMSTGVGAQEKFVLLPV